MIDHNRRFLDQPISPSEYAICHFIGQLRHKETSKHGTERRQDQSLDSMQMSIDGVITEYAVAKALGLFFDINCDYRKFGADLVSKKGKLIDVKSTKQPGGNLNAVVWSGGKPVDVFVLTEIRPTHVRLIGWIDQQTFLQDDNIRDVGNGPFYSLPQSSLRPFDEQLYQKTL